MADYKFFSNLLSGEVVGVIRTRDGAMIPLADGNVDYEEFKSWLSIRGNTPDPADPPPPPPTPDPIDQLREKMRADPTIIERIK